MKAAQPFARPRQNLLCLLVVLSILGLTVFSLVYDLGPRARAREELRTSARREALFRLPAPAPFPGS